MLDEIRQKNCCPCGQISDYYANGQNDGNSNEIYDASEQRAPLNHCAVVCT